MNASRPIPRILFVCLGNICRSPTAEGVFRTLAAREGLAVSVDSAGTAGWHAGKPPYGPSIAAAARRGYDLSDLRARQLTAADFDAFDHVLVMDRANLADAAALRRSGAEPRLFLDHAPETGRAEVPDPYHTRDFDGALDLIEAASRGLIARLKAAQMR
ncbi:low molecular weight phosphotyrosine protein phosphatase [Aliigemmobacter aestuarii]|uniref:protein-tyrosine-phosphatase n=1 Tax=Aliigemmobacter aestuarii TaxID=1445661 RepID=A0A4S3MJX6_9RHOB|nr:low molecular weight protein-tyrosine-phosphatase [Gemmobacter aestuarii]THD81526.1 low molecular weight phosphotyrosine protein phosphatase [Gemmobacter aestuarii]